MFELEDETMKDLVQFEGVVYKLMADASENIRKKRAEEYQRIRATYKYTFEEFEYDEEFEKKYNVYPGSTLYQLNTPNGILEGYLFSNNKSEKELNTQRFVHLNPYFEEKYSDEIMVSCHGKNWEVADEKTGKPASPWHLSRYDIIFDTETCEVIFETDKKAFDHTYMWFFDNVVKIKQERHGTIYFDMVNRKEICSSDYDMIETKDNLIIGKSTYYGKERNSATVINKHTCEVTYIE